jgi:hypothetical protein
MGHANITTKSSDISFTPDQDSMVYFRGEASVKASALDFQNLDLDDLSSIISPLLSNYGAGIAFGFNVKFPFGLELRSSILDLGFIKWSNGNYNYDVKHNHSFIGYREDGTIVIKGVDFSIDKLLYDINGIYDKHKDDLYGDYGSFKEILEDALIIENIPNSYISMTYPKFFLEASYNIGIHKFALMSRFDFVNKRVLSLFTVGYNLNVRKVMDLALSYTIGKGYYKNLGVALSFNFGDVFHLYVGTDNILGVINPIPLASSYIKTNDLNVEELKKLKHNFINIQTGLYFTIPQAKKKIVQTSMKRSY